MITSSYSSPSFESAMEQVRSILHNLSIQAIQEIEATLEIDPGFIQNHYGLGTPQQNSSQWHLKRYSQEINKSISNGDDQNNDNNDFDLALGVHTDPSIVSVVIHDAIGIQDGGLGLEHAKKIDDRSDCQSPHSKPSTTTGECWYEVPYHGHGIATIMCGSALARIMQVGENTNKDPKVDALRKFFPPVKHRVVMKEELSSVDSQNRRRRMAMTYFLRPVPSSILEPLPIFTELLVTPPRKKLAFGTWYQRVQSRYGKSKSKKSKNGERLSRKN